MQFMWRVIETHKIIIHLLQATDRWAEVVDGEEQALWHVKRLLRAAIILQESSVFWHESCLNVCSTGLQN